MGRMEEEMKRIVRFMMRWINCECQICGKPTLTKDSIYAGLCPECDSIELYKDTGKAEL